MAYERMMIMTIEINIEARDGMRVNTEGRNGKKFAVKLEGVTLYFDRKDLEELEELIEAELWDETEHRDYLKNKLDEADLIVDELTERVEYYDALSEREAV
jgi:hypothetical protein